MEAASLTGVRILLHLSANDAPMGSVLPAGPVHFEGSVHGVGPLERIELVRYDGATWSTVWASDVGGAFDADFSAEDPGATGSLYYLRVRQQDGNRAWSSPVWVE